MTAATLALVESPVQLLHTLEWGHSSGVAAELSVLVLAPRDDVSRRQLRAVLRFADEEGAVAHWLEPRQLSGSLPGVFSRLRRAVSRAERLLVGDPFSGLVQALLPGAGVEDVVVLDDGTATIDFTARLADGRPLTRWARSRGGARGWLRDRLGLSAGAFFTPGQGRRVSAFTVMPCTPVPGMVRQPNRYGWTRGRFGVPDVVPGTDVVGCSLVETGMLESEAYLEAVAALVAASGRAGRYYAHRREDDAKLRQVAERTGLEVVRPEVPLEIQLRRGPVAEEVVSFPSSVGYTLPVVLSGAPVNVRLVPVEPAWIRAGVSPSAREFLATMARQSPLLSPIGGASPSALRNAR